MPGLQMKQFPKDGYMPNICGKVNKKQTEKKKKSGDISGRNMIANALRDLLAEKDFNSITTADIASRSGRNESLIYRYFGDKKGLLYQVLEEYLLEAEKKTSFYVRKNMSSVELLQRIVTDCLDHYNRNYVYARVLFVESRTFPGFYESETYELVKKFSQNLTAIIRKGMEKGEIRDDVPAEKIRDVILGGIEHFSLPKALFGKDIAPDMDAKFLNAIVFEGIRVKEKGTSPD